MSVKYFKKAMLASNSPGNLANVGSNSAPPSGDNPRPEELAGANKPRLAADGIPGWTGEYGAFSGEKFYDKALSIIRQLKLKGTVLDYGSGAGNFTKRLVNEKVFQRVFSADILERPLDLNAVEWIQADLNQPLAVTNDCFDAIISLEVIEHLENPRATVRDWFRLLKPGGMVVFSTPNNESLQALFTLLIKGHFKAFTDHWYPNHITALLRRDIERIMKEVGFADLEIEYIASTTLKRLSPLVRPDTRRTASNLIAYAHKPE